MGNASHKNQNAFGILDTTLSPYRVAEVAHAISGKSFVDRVRYEGAGTGIMYFSVRGFGPIDEKMTFELAITSTPQGTQARADIARFITSQNVVAGFIPVSKKELKGYKAYKEFFDALATALTTEDPATRFTFREAA